MVVLAGCTGAGVTGEEPTTAPATESAASPTTQTTASATSTTEPHTAVGTSHINDHSSVPASCGVDNVTVALAPAPTARRPTT